uniref:At4g15545-like C-terminal domain-containing protein n=1 Tax=Physcomitrium patens TaxID=3218 RepID=A0A7I4B8D8_PHYPA
MMASFWFLRGDAEFLRAKLANEKNALAAQVKKLMRDVAKLETFKRTLMQSLQEDDDNPKAEGGDKRGVSSNLAIRRASQAESSLSRALDDDGQSTKSFSTSSSVNTEERGFREGGASKPPTSYQTSAHNSAQGTPHLSPKLTSSGSGRASPRRSMSLTDNSHRISLPSSKPTSQSTTAPNSPPSHGSAPSRTPRVDGKDFFRQARNRLSYEQFSAFLANIKELNAHRQTREETLRKAEETFGPDNKDLYAAFDGLLSRHLPF